jgi:type IV pilus assembly protein PilA
MKRLNERRAAEFELEGSADAGFTLIELMVVLLILAILLAIAIPTFLGVTGGANDRASQSNLNTALTTAKAMATQNNQTYLDTTATPVQTAVTQLALLKSNEPSITFVAGAVTTQGPVSVYFEPTGAGVVMASFSKSTNKCWYAVDNLQFIAGGAANGLYTDVVANPGITGSATSAPTAAGTYYGKSTNACDASATTLTGGKWGSTFSNVPA